MLRAQLTGVPQAATGLTEPSFQLYSALQCLQTCRQAGAAALRGQGRTLAMLSTISALLRLMGVVCWTARPLSSRGAIMASSGLSTACTKVVEASLCTHWGTSAGLARQVTSTGMKGLMSLLLRAPQARFRDLLAAFCAAHSELAPDAASGSCVGMVGGVGAAW